MTFLIKNVLHQIQDVSLYVCIALVLFLLIFIVAVWRVFRQPRQEIEHLAQLPVEDD